MQIKPTTQIECSKEATISNEISQSKALYHRIRGNQTIIRYGSELQSTTSETQGQTKISLSQLHSARK